MRIEKKKSSKFTKFVLLYIIILLFLLFPVIIFTIFNNEYNVYAVYIMYITVICNAKLGNRTVLFRLQGEKKCKMQIIKCYKPYNHANELVYKL